MNSSYGAVIPAGGSSVRFGGDKLFALLKGKPVFIYSLIAFREVIPERNIILCVPPARISEFSDTIQKYLPGSKIKITAGGPTRIHSVLNGLERLPDTIEIAAVHDAARPLVTPELIQRCYEECKNHQGAVAASKPVDTIKVCPADSGLLETGGIHRDTLRAVQTPQTFFREPLLEATRKAAISGLPFTDDASIMEYYTGIKAFPVEQPAPNLKITHQNDLKTAELFIGIAEY